MQVVMQKPIMPARIFEIIRSLTSRFTICVSSCRRTASITSSCSDCKRPRVTVMAQCRGPLPTLQRYLTECDLSGIAEIKDCFPLLVFRLNQPKESRPHRRRGRPSPTRPELEPDRAGSRYRCRCVRVALIARLGRETRSGRVASLLRGRAQCGSLRRFRGKAQRNPWAGTRCQRGGRGRRSRMLRRFAAELRSASAKRPPRSGARQRARSRAPENVNALGQLGRGRFHAYYLSLNLEPDRAGSRHRRLLCAAICRCSQNRR
jgi:hypothetical protein